MNLFKEVAAINLNLTYHTGFHFGFSLLGHFDDWDADMERVRLWCVEQFGPAGTRWKPGVSAFMFMDANDAFAFKLQWC